MALLAVAINSTDPQRVPSTRSLTYFPRQWPKGGTAANGDRPVEHGYSRSGCRMTQHLVWQLSVRSVAALQLEAL